MPSVWVGSVTIGKFGGKNWKNIYIAEEIRFLIVWWKNPKKRLKFSDLLFNFIESEKNYKNDIIPKYKHYIHTGLSIKYLFKSVIFFCGQKCFFPNPTVR